APCRRRDRGRPKRAQQGRGDSGRERRACDRAPHQGGSMTARRVHFEKWEGLGNDFVLLADPEFALSTDVVKRLCDRRFGIGADGILLVDRPTGGSPRMTVYNADGSRPEMCGNGLRCVAGFLARGSDRGATEITIATDAGDKRCAIERTRDDEAV